MDLERSEDGRWSVEPTEEERGLKPDYLEALPRYLSILDEIFAKAQERSEFDFIHALLGIRSLQDAGWVPYETTLQAIESATNLHNETGDSTAARHLQLWIYGHIIEASEPYELLANLLRIGRGDRYHTDVFEQRKQERPISPATTMDAIGELGAACGFPDAAVPMKEPWDREFRNAVFHADYALHGSEVRLPEVGRRMSGGQQPIDTRQCQDWKKVRHGQCVKAWPAQLSHASS